jgi:hypothetical protein
MSTARSEPSLSPKGPADLSRRLKMTDGVSNPRSMVIPERVEKGYSASSSRCNIRFFKIAIGYDLVAVRHDSPGIRFYSLGDDIDTGEMFRIRESTAGSRRPHALIAVSAESA